MNKPIQTKSSTGLAIFNTFKTKGSDLTGEARRQRAIIAILGSKFNPAERNQNWDFSKNSKKARYALEECILWNIS